MVYVYEKMYEKILIYVYMYYKRIYNMKNKSERGASTIHHGWRKRSLARRETAPVGFRPVATSQE